MKAYEAVADFIARRDLGEVAGFKALGRVPPARQLSRWRVLFARRAQAPRADFRFTPPAHEHSLCAGGSSSHPPCGNGRGATRDADTVLAVWQTLIEAGDFPHFTALRRVFPAADQVKVGSGRTVTVFNLRGNRYRLVAAVHCNRALVYALRFLTHADYSKDRWKDDL